MFAWLWTCSLPGVLISSSLPAISWQTEQPVHPPNTASEVLSSIGRRATSGDAASRTTQQAAQRRSDASEAHTGGRSDHRREAVRGKEHAHTEAHRETHNGEPQNRHNRRAHRKAADDTQPANNESANGASNSTATHAAQEGAPPPFQAILSDVLPPDAQAGSGDDGQANPEHTNFRVDPLGPGFPTGKDQTALAATELPRGSVAQNAESLAGKRDAKAATQADTAMAIDRIGGTRAESNAKSVVERSEMAFAARIAGRAAAVAALDPGHGQAAIAASRFNGQGAQDHKDSGGSSPAKNNPTAAKEGDAKPESQASADSQDSPGQDKQPAGAENANGRAAGGQTQSHGTGAESTTATREGSSGAAGQGAISGMAAAASGPAGAPGSTASAAGKAAAETRAPQFLEPQTEAAGRGGDRVRDISLQLSGKDQSSVQVRLTERAGELQVSVRTPDTGLTRGLREGLSDLVGRLEHTGYRAETWQPTDSGSSPRDSSQDSPSHGDSSREQNGGDSNRGAGQQQNSREQQQPDAQTPKWVRELESSLQRSNSSWHSSAR